MKYKFYIDNKNTVWDRVTYAIDVKSEAEGLAIAMKLLEGQDDELAQPIDYDTMNDTMTDMSVEDNGGYSTRELFYKDKKIAENGISIDSTHQTQTS